VSESCCPLLINDYPAQLAAAQAHLMRRLQPYPDRAVAVFGAGDVGRAVITLLRSCAVPVQGVYDDARSGDCAGLRIEGDRARLPPGVPVVVASTRALGELGDLTSWLRAHGNPVLHCSARSGPMLQDLVQRHAGETCYVIGNGPSLNRTPLELLRGQKTFGCNRIYLGLERFGLRLDYWTIEDPLVAEDTVDEWTALDGALRLVPEDLLWLVPDVNAVCPIPFRRQPFGPHLPRFGRSAAELFWGGTVSYLMIQLAALMGFSRVVLLGIDFSYERPDHVTALAHPDQWQSHGPDPNHFDPSYFGAGRKWHDPRVDRMHLAYRAAAAFAEQSGLQIVNATPGTRLDVFPEVRLEDPR
jgi:hypothetical protein